MLAAERYDGAEPVNLGTGVEISIRDLAELVREATGFEGDRVGPVEAERAAAPLSRHERGPSCSASRRERSRRPRRTVEWYRFEPLRDEHGGDPSGPAVGLSLQPSHAADTVARHVIVVLAAIVAFQILATVALFFSVNHNGWLTYQGGDQIWLATSAWLLGKGMIGFALTEPRLAAACSPP